VDTTKVRTLLAGLLAPQSSGPHFNFFDSSSALAVPHGLSQESADDPPLACVSCRGAVGVSALNSRYLVALVSSSGHSYSRFRCELCGPLEGEHPEVDVIDSNWSTPPSPPGLSPTDVWSLRPGNIISPALLHHLCTRIRHDAARDYGDRAGMFHMLPPTLLPPLTEEPKTRKDLHRKLPIPPFKCDPHSGQTLLLPILVMGHWMLAVILPRRSRGRINIVSSRRSYGIAAVKKALRATLCTENTPLRCLEGPPIVSWDIHYPFSPTEAPRSLDGGIHILLHIAGLYSNSPPPDEFDSSRVRAILAGLVTSPSESNFFGLETAPATQSSTALASADC